MQFIISLTRTDQGRRAIKDTAKRVQGARDLAKKMGVEIEHLFHQWRYRYCNRRQCAERRQCCQNGAGAWFVGQCVYSNGARMV
jgi:hypothetical protein